MKDVVLQERLFLQLQDIYKSLENDYDNVAHQLHFSCEGCPDNCCDSYFLHHTYAEWAYLWLGFKKLDEVKQKELLLKSREYVEKCGIAEKNNERPEVMCPLNEQGRCILYIHRLLVCRTHGVPATLTRPDGQAMRFPGCFRCQEIVEKKYIDSKPPHVERTMLLQKLALLENELLNNRRHLMPKVRLTIAEMLIKGPPSLPTPHCQR